MWKIALFLIVIGGVIAYEGVRESKLADAASATPERITLEKLVARGPDGNANVIVTDFEPCDNFLTTKNSKTNVWQSVWIPIVKKGTHGDGPAPASVKNVQVMVFTDKAKNEGELIGRVGGPEIRGLITNRISAIGSEQQEKLRGAYPQTDFAKCLILHDGREPASGGSTLLMKLGGVALSLAGIALFVVPLIPRKQPNPYPDA